MDQHKQTTAGEKHTEHRPTPPRGELRELPATGLPLGVDRSFE